MSWPKPNVTNIVKQPISFSRAKWGIFFVVLIIITALILAALWPDKSFATQFTYWAGVILIPTIIGGSAFGVRIYLYGLAQEEYEIWQNEQQTIDNNWQNWAMKSLVVLESYYYLVSDVNARKIYDDEINIDSQINKSLEFEETFELKHKLEDLFIKFNKILALLPKSETLHITVYSSDKSYQPIDNEINQAIRASNIENKFTLQQQILFRNTNIKKIVENIDTPDSGLELIIINNQKSEGSAFLASFLLLNKDYYEDLKLDFAKIEILRPMIANDLEEGLNQMVEMQSALKTINQLWVTNISNKQKADVAKELTLHEISPEHIYSLESFVGKSTELTYWLALALTCEMMSITQNNNLIVSESQHQWQFSVIKNV